MSGIIDQVADQAPAPPQAAAPAAGQYSAGSLAYMLVFGAIAWVGGKLAEGLFGETVESTINSGKEFVNSFGSKDEDGEPEAETEDDEEEPDEE